MIGTMSGLGQTECESTTDPSKDCCAMRESAARVLDGMIASRERELAELTSFREMVPDDISKAADELIWKMLMSYRREY